MTRMACASGTKVGLGVERSVIYIFRFAYESESEWCVKFVGGWMFVLLDHAAGCQQVGISRLISSLMSSQRPDTSNGKKLRVHETADRATRRRQRTPTLSSMGVHGPLPPRARRSPRLRIFINDDAHL